MLFGLLTARGKIVMKQDYWPAVLYVDCDVKWMFTVYFEVGVSHSTHPRKNREKI